MENKVYNFVKRNMGYIIVAISITVYVLTSFVQIAKTGKTVSQILADGITTMIFGFCINRFFELQGIIISDDDERLKKTIKLHGDLVERIAPYLNRLDDWCELRNKENKRLQRAKILATEGLKYDDFFDEEGGVLAYTPKYDNTQNKALASLEKARLECYKRAVHIKLTPLTAGTLTSDGVKPDDIYDFGRTKTEYQKQSTFGDIVTRALMAVVFGYFGVEQVINFSYANLVWKGFQICVFLLSGILTLFKSKIYMTDEYRGRIVKKIDNLTMFENYIKEQNDGNT